ncbi:MAG: hypothetical protein KF819_10345 [Labilithrix sp.]|nr:hypothetical protein [Labilithrix sp.]
MEVTASMGPAWEQMKRVLFRPFNLGTWFSFGFIFFLQSCLEGGGGNNFNVPSGNGGGGSNHGSDDSISGILGTIAHRPSSPLELLDDSMLGIIVAVTVVVAIPMLILMYWLGTRGQMMAIRAVATGQADIGDAWRNTREAGGRLFKFYLALFGIGFVMFVPLAGAGALLVIPVIREGGRLTDALPVLLGLGFVALLFVVPLMVVGAMSRNFVSPIMLKHGLGARDAWKRFWAVGRDHVGGIIVFFLLRFVVGIGATFVGLLAGVLTCCLGLLPVLHQTLMAPYYVFERAWTLEVLASMSADFDLRGGPPQAPMPYPDPSAYAAPPGANPYVPSDNPYAPPGGGYGGPPPGGFGGPT